MARQHGLRRGHAAATLMCALFATSSISLFQRRTSLSASVDLKPVRQPPQTNPTSISNLTSISSSDPPVSASNFPRVVFWTPSYRDENGTTTTTNVSLRKYELPRVIREFGIPGTYRAPETKCKPVHKWPKRIYPNCAVVHEVDFFGGLLKSLAKDTHYPTQVKRMGAGGTRDTWKADVMEPDGPRSLAFKTLRTIKEYFWTRTDHQRIDAAVSERISASPHVIDIYAYCGTATINEFGSQGTLRSYVLDHDDTLTPLQRLELARDIAFGTAAVHEADMVSHDVKLVNFMVSDDGKAKASDFNNAHFLSMNRNKTCPYRFSKPCEDNNLKIEVSFFVALRSFYGSSLLLLGGGRRGVTGRSLSPFSHLLFSLLACPCEASCTRM